MAGKTSDERIKLGVEWETMFCHPAPHKSSVQLIELCLRIEKERKGSKAHVGRVAAKLASRLARKNTQKRTTFKLELPLGTEICRPWNGREIRVQVCEDGFYCEGKVYPSLSALASSVTGTKRSGPVFFGLTS